MANPTCRNCDRSADTGAYCSSCAAGIMASALNPHFRSRRKRLPIKQLKQRTLPRRLGPTAGAHPVSNACSGSPETSVTGCNDNEEDRSLLDLRPHLLGVAAQGAELLLGEVPRAASPLGLQEA